MLSDRESWFSLGGEAEEMGLMGIMKWFHKIFFFFHTLNYHFAARRKKLTLQIVDPATGEIVSGGVAARTVSIPLSLPSYFSV